MIKAKVKLPCVYSNSILTVAPVVLLDHPVAPALVVPLYKPVKDAEAVDKPQVVLEVVYQRAVRLALPAQLVNDCLSMCLWGYCEHIVRRVHLGPGLPGNDRHHVDLVAVALLDAARQDVIVALGGAIEGKLVPGVLGLCRVGADTDHGGPGRSGSQLPQEVVAQDGLCM